MKRIGPAEKTEMWTLRLKGPLQGYVSRTSRGKFSPRAKRYHQWLNYVRAEADAVGVPREIPPDRRALIEVSVIWKGKARIDLCNVFKGIEDGIFMYDRRTKYIRAEHHEKQYMEEAATVFVRFCEAL